MAISIPIPTKAYTSSANTTGVPDAELTSIVGETTSVTLGQRTIPTWGFLATAVLIPGEVVDRSVHSLVYVDLISSNGVLVHTWEYDINQWLGVATAAEGDTLDGTTAVITTNLGVGSMLSGRTVTNGVLVQSGTYDPGSGANYVIRVRAREFSGGAINRRFDALSTHPSQTLFAWTRANTTPTLPSASRFRYTGNRHELSISASSGETDWYNILAAPTNTGTNQYLLILNAVYSYTTGEWTVSPRNIVLANNSVQVGFADSIASTTWTAVPAASGDVYLRHRLPDGNYSYHAVREVDQVETDYGRVTIFDGSIGPNQNVKTFTFTDFDWIDYNWMELVWIQFDGSDVVRHNVIVAPANVVKTVASLDSDSDVRWSNQITSGVSGQNWHFGEQHARGSNQSITNASIRLNLTHTSAAAGSRNADSCVIRTGYTSQQIYFTLRVF